MISFGINWDFIKKFLGIKPDDVPIKIEEMAMTRKDQILDSLRQGGSGTSRQIAKRLGLSLSVTRTHLTVLHQRGLIKDSGENVGVGIRTQNIWAAVDT